MPEWRIEALWDRPAKYMAQPSTHHLLLRITPGTPAETDPLALRSADAHSETDTPPPPSEAPSIALALDCSRSMSENDSFAACAAAVNMLLAGYRSSCDLRLATFSKAVIPLHADRMAEQLLTHKLRSVSRYDLALQWLVEQSSSAGAVPRLAVLLGDGTATDEHGYEANAELLLATAQRLTASGTRLLLALTNSQGALWGALSQLDLVTLLHPSGLQQTLAELLGGLVSTPASPAAAEQPVSTTSESGLCLRLDSRLQGLQPGRVMRLRPQPGCLFARSSQSGSWLLNVGELAPWETLELLLELSLPLAQFGALEGPGPTLTASLQDTSGNELAARDCQLDFTADPRRAQQLGSETDQARRKWELAALDSWPASQAEQRAKRQTGKLPPLPGFASAPPAGGVPQ